ncbi:hypothetical protein QQX98_005629 [Neonectria punicea]|uniref:Spore coat protein SP96 n=1 Tax=Neonectria punicea TaxID=979145 RepID=A0ABR1H4N0_9HYPO
MKVFQSIALAFGLAGVAQAHMEMIFPPPFKSKANPFAGSDVDYSMTAPLEASGGNFPCKGYQSLLGTDAGKATASFKPGETYNMTITGGANHGGGSCQASLSFDKGTTWKVIHSYVGNCPAAGTSSFDFTIPTDTPSGEAVFAWTWFNQIGNREMYMNCAAVDITGGSAKRASALSSRPDMFVANVGNGCTTKESSDLAFPDPGDEVDDDSSNTSPPVGSCASGGGSSGGDDGSSNTTPAASTTAAATYSQPAASNSAPADGAESSMYVQPSAPASSVVSNSPTSSPGGVFITVSDPADGTAAAPTSVAASTDAAVPTSMASTLVTVTKSAGNSAPAATATTPVSAPAATPTSGSGDGSSSGAQTAGSACSTEGEWNCVGGSQFQRCASGVWSVLMAVADGTTCESGQSSTLAMSGKRRSFRRFRGRAEARV